MPAFREDWDFYLPVASAILSVFWPDEFSIYNVRVCDQLGRFRGLGSKTAFRACEGGKWNSFLNASVK
jgi:hypothetical protein